MTNCPFYPYCKYVGNNDSDIVTHIIGKHAVAKSHCYGDKYHGNGFKNTLEISNEKLDGVKRT